MNAYVLDAIPIPVLFALMTVGSLIAYGGGYRLGAWWDRHVGPADENSSARLVGAILGLQSFLLAVTMGMAADRFAARQRLVTDEATAIEQLYLRAGSLESATDRDALRSSLNAYLPLRISTPDRAQLVENWRRSGDLLIDMWFITERAAQRDPGAGPILAALTEENGLHRVRLQSNVEDRVPEEILLVLLGGIVASLVLVGFSDPRGKRPDLVAAVAVAIGFAAVLTVVIDLDRPRDGLLQVSQQPLLDLQAEFRSIDARGAAR